jgi:hypothetical protein
VVAQQLYTLWVGGSNPSSPTIPNLATGAKTVQKRFSFQYANALSRNHCSSNEKSHAGPQGPEARNFLENHLALVRICPHNLNMKARIVCTLTLLATVGFLFAQAEQVKGKAKDLKKKVEGQQTNQVDRANPPKK